jgi:hypothetical protein
VQGIEIYLSAQGGTVELDLRFAADVTEKHISSLMQQIAVVMAEIDSVDPIGLTHQLQRDAERFGEPSIRGIKIRYQYADSRFPEKLDDALRNSRVNSPLM